MRRLRDLRDEHIRHVRRGLDVFVDRHELNRGLQLILDSDLVAPLRRLWDWLGEFPR